MYIEINRAGAWEKGNLHTCEERRLRRMSLSICAFSPEALQYMEPQEASDKRTDKVGIWW